MENHSWFPRSIPLTLNEPEPMYRRNRARHAAPRHVDPDDPDGPHWWKSERKKEQGINENKHKHMFRDNTKTKQLKLETASRNSPTLVLHVYWLTCVV